MIGAFGRAAATYDEVGVEFFRTFGAELVRRAGIRPGGIVLDAGAGRGAVAFPAARAGARVVAVDLAPEMVELLAADASRLGLDVDARVMDAENPDLPAGSFDAVLGSMVIFMLGDPPAALRRYRELLRPGGRVGVTIFGGYSDEWKPLGGILDAASPVRGDRAPSRDGPVSTPARLEETLRAAGFADVTTEVVPHEVVFASAAQWWDWSWSHGRRIVLESQSPESFERLKADVDAELARLAEPDGRLRLRQNVCYALAT
jgi:SAM-dependent methyltransferase